VANLLLARGAMRQREFAVRAALGAARSRLVTQMLVESVTRALAGGALGIGVAYGAVWAAHRWLSVSVPRFAQVTIDGRVLVVSVLVSVLPGVLFGLVPALRAARGELNTGLREGGRGVFGSAHRDRVRRAMITAEVALSVTLLVAAALLLRSFAALTSVPKGFDMRDLTTAAIGLPLARYPDSVRQQMFYRGLLREVGSMPGVRGAALVSSLPIEGGTNGAVAIEGKTYPAGADPIAEKRVVSANYHQVLGARLRAGRFFDSRDVAGAPPVVIVNETFVKRYFPGEQAVGRRVDFTWGTICCQTIVGVVADLREGALNQESAPAMYIPVEQRTSDFMFLVARTSLATNAFAAALRQKLRVIDPMMPVATLRTFDEVMGAGVSRERLSATLVSAFAALALLLAGVGLYGVVSYAVAQRTQELGVRAALGASRGHIIRLVLRQGLSAVVLGSVIGIVGSFVVGRLIASHLFGVESNDPAALVAAILALGTTALVAAGVPAMRAARADPLDALRID
jgi:putative ABC transport system permease protein